MGKIKFLQSHIKTTNFLADSRTENCWSTVDMGDQIYFFMILNSVNKPVIFICIWPKIQEIHCSPFMRGGGLFVGELNTTKTIELLLIDHIDYIDY